MFPSETPRLIVTMQQGEMLLIHNSFIGKGHYFFIFSEHQSLIQNMNKYFQIKPSTFWKWQQLLKLKHRNNWAFFSWGHQWPFMCFMYTFFGTFDSCHLVHVRPIHSTVLFQERHFEHLCGFNLTNHTYLPGQHNLSSKRRFQYTVTKCSACIHETSFEMTAGTKAWMSSASPRAVGVQVPRPGPLVPVDGWGLRLAAGEGAADWAGRRWRVRVVLPRHPSALGSAGGPDAGPVGGLRFGVWRLAEVDVVAGKRAPGGP